MIMNIGRPLEFDPEQVLEAAMQLFWARGYDATSLQALLNAMGLSKSSFYQAFGGKQPLFERCIQRYRESVAADMLSRLEKAKSGRQFIADTLYAVADEARGHEKPRGCLVMNTANEFAQRDRAVAEWVKRSVGRFTAVFKAAVRQAQEEGDIASGKDATVLATYLVSSMSGLRTMVKAGTDQKTVRDIVRLILKALD